MAFITNNFAWSPRTVAELYRARWAIETFFKEGSSRRSSSPTSSATTKAVKWQVWTGLLAHLLLCASSSTSRSGAELSRLMRHRQIGGLDEDRPARRPCGNMGQRAAPSVL